MSDNMKRKTMIILIPLLGVVCCKGLAAQGLSSTKVDRQVSAAKTKLQVASDYGKLPLSFEANEGQTDAKVKFLSRGIGQTLFLTSKGAVLTFGGRHALRLNLIGANTNTRVTGLDRLPGHSNYFLGNDPTGWHTDVPTFSRVRYSDAYPGIDLLFYGNQRRLEYDFVVAPGADPQQISLGIPEATKISLDADGNVILRFGDNKLQLTKPHVFQDVAGQRTEIAGGYLLKGHRLSFKIASYDHHQALTIDPQLVYSTYLGGSSGDSGNAIALDSTGNAYVTGYTSSANFPVSSGAFQPTQHGGQDVFVAKLNASGTGLVYATFIGGSNDDSASAIAVDQSGNVYLTGTTTSHDFPVSSGAFQTTYGPDGSSVEGTAVCGGFHAFVAKLNFTGNQLVYSTYLQGTGNDLGYGIAVDSQSNAYVAGNTTSTNFPVTGGSYQTTFAGGESVGTCVHPSDAFVTKLNPTGSAVVYSTFLGGSDNEGTAGGIAVDSSGNAFVTGSTQSSNFPTTTGAFQTKSGGGTALSGVAQPDAFITKLNPSGSALIYSTYLGGSAEDIGYGIALDSSENAYVTGLTSSTNFPVTLGAIENTYGGGPFDAFVAELNVSGTALVYSTYLGGNNDDEATAIAVDSLGSAYITGTTNSTNYPVTANAIQAVNKGGYDAFVTKVSPQGQSLVYSTYLGGTDDDQGNGITVDQSGNAFVTGSSFASDFPLKSPLQSTNRALSNGNTNAFVAEIASQLTGTMPSATTLASSATQTVFGQSVTFTATVSGAGGTPTGAVVFSDAGSTIGSLSLSNGQAALTISSLGPGPHSITASYSGDATFAASISAAVPETVSQAATTVTLTSSSVSVSFAQSVTFTASLSVVSPGIGTPTGTVSFNDGPNTLASVPVTTSGTVSFSTSSLAIGTHSITASYTGDSNFQAQSSDTVAVVVNWPAPYVGPPSVLSIAAGSGPVGMALNPATERIYVANQSSNNVTVIDAKTNQVITTIPVGKAPSAVAINSQTNKIYVADRDSADVAVIDGASNLPVFISVPSTIAPDSIAVEPGTGNVYVGTGGAGVLAVINAASQQVSSPDPSALLGPIAITPSPLSGRVYVAELQDSDLETYESVTTFLLNGFGISKPQALAINPPTLYVADGAGNLYIVDETGTNSPLPFSVGLNPHAIGANPADNTIYLADQSPTAGQAATVTQFAANNNSVVAMYTVGPSAVPARTPAPNKIAIDTAANLVYVANEGSNSVTIIDGGVRNVLSTVPTGTTPTAVLLDPLKCSAYVTNFGAGTVSVIQPSVSGPAVCLSKSSLIFGRVAVGTSSAAQTVILTNIGNSALSVSSINSPIGFSETDNCPAVAPSPVRLIPPGGQCAIQEVFAASAHGISTGNLTITDNAGGSPHIVVLSADAVLPTTTQLTLNNPVVYGQAVSMSAQVVGTPGTPTGSVTFFEDGQTVLATMKVGAGAVASSTTSFPFLLPVGSQHTITATYNGDLNFGGSSSAATPIVVNKDATFFSEAAEVHTQPLQMQATVDASSPGGGVPTGIVVFLEGQSADASAILNANGTATSPVVLPPGLHQITAQYQGDGNFLPSPSTPFQVIVPAPTVSTVTASPSAHVSTFGTPVTFTLAVTTGVSTLGNLSGNVTFLDGPNKIGSFGLNGSSTSGTVTTPASTFPVGQHSITAVYQDTTGNFLGSTSRPFLLTVTQSGAVGGPGSCACALQGAYAGPVAPVEPSASTVSPHNIYTVIPSAASSSFTVQRNSDGKNLLTINYATTPIFGFSPDDDRFTLHSVTGGIDNVSVYDLTSVSPSNLTPRQIVITESNANMISDALSFSPSGRYFLYEFTSANGDGSNSAHIQIFQVQSTASQLLLYDSGDFRFASAAGSGEDSFGVLSQGFSPDNPETTFLYAYVSGPNVAGKIPTQWSLVSLVNPHSVVASGTFTDVADVWEFSPCGDVLADIRQLQSLATGASNVAEVDLTFTPTGASLNPGGYMTSTINSILLSCSSQGQQITDLSKSPSATITILAPNGGCSNTPVTAPNGTATVVPADSGGSGLAPVTITFTGVSQPGTTTMFISTSSGQSIPPNTQPGTPSLVFDLTTTAQFTSAQVCINYSGISFTGSNLLLLHNGIPIPTKIDPVHQTVCGTTTSFSPFIIVQQVSVSATTTMIASSVNSPVYGQSVTFTATVTSSGTIPGGPLVFSDGGTTIGTTTLDSSGTARVSTSSLSAGVHSITATYAGNASFTGSASAPLSFSVIPAPLTVAANNGTRPYGANNPVLAPPLISGIQNLDSISSTYTIGATTASPVGAYPVVPSAVGAPGVLANYSVSLINGTLNVLPETTTIAVTFSPLSIMVGQSTTATITLAAPDMVVPIPNNSSILTPFALTSPLVSDMLPNNGVCTPVPSATVPAVASCTVTVTSVEPNGRTLLASFAGSPDLAASTSAASGTGQLMVTAALKSQPVCIASDFRNVAVPGNNIVWFNSIFKVRDVAKQLLHVTFYNSSAQFQYTDAGGNLVNVNLPLPDAHITIDPSATSSSTSYDSINKVWNTAIPWDLDDNSFLTGASWTIPSAGLPADVEPVTVCGTFASDVASIDIGWRWAAAAYSSFASDLGALGVKPMDTDFDNPGGTANHDLAGTPENFKQYVIAGARGKGGKNYTGSYSRSAVIE